MKSSTISLVSSGPQLVRPAPPEKRSWVPVAAAAVIVVVVAATVLIFEHGQHTPTVIPATARTDPYAANLAVSQLTMSEAANLAGGKSTYLDGRLANNGSKTVTGIEVQVLFRDPANEIAWNISQPLMIIRTRDPYIDVEPVSAAPLKPGDTRDFRLIFDNVPEDWDGAYPEIRIIHVDAR